MVNGLEQIVAGFLEEQDSVLLQGYLGVRGFPHLALPIPPSSIGIGPTSSDVPFTNMLYTTGQLFRLLYYTMLIKLSSISPPPPVRWPRMQAPDKISRSTHGLAYAEVCWHPPPG